MNRQVLVWSLCGLFLWVPVVHAIPPPWQLEEMKANADVIAIVETTEIEPVKDVKPFNRRVGINLIRMLKTDVNESDHATARDLQGNVFFSPPDAPKSKDGIAAMSIGRPGNPKLAAADHVLVFLKRLEGKNAFSVVCGKFGYIRLNARSEKELRRVSLDITRYREWSEKIADDELRKAMVDCYRQALIFVDNNNGDVCK